MKTYYVYIMTGRTRRLYLDSTDDLVRRTNEHEHHVIPGFTSKYYLNRLVYYEEFADAAAAVARERELKGWSRAKKIALIESKNPRWSDLSREW